MDWTKEAILAAGGRAALARALGVSTQAVSFWVHGLRTPDPATCTKLAGDFGIAHWRTRPKDWHLIWDGLIGSPGAPSVPVEQGS